MAPPFPCQNRWTTEGKLAEKHSVEELLAKKPRRGTSRRNTEDLAKNPVEEPLAAAHGRYIGETDKKDAAAAFPT